MAQHTRPEQSSGGQQNGTFKRHGPEPPENDSGPSPSVDETTRAIHQESAESKPSLEGNAGKRPNH